VLRADYFVVTPPEDVAPVEPLVPELLLVPAREGAVDEVVPEVDGGDAVPLIEPPAAPIPDAVPEAVPDTGPVLQAAREAAHASAINILVMAELLDENGKEFSIAQTAKWMTLHARLPHVRRGACLRPDLSFAEIGPR
jgi:hypothetical protein